MLILYLPFIFTCLENFLVCQTISVLHFTRWINFELWKRSFFSPIWPAVQQCLYSSLYLMTNEGGGKEKILRVLQISKQPVGIKILFTRIFSSPSPELGDLVLETNNGWERFEREDAKGKSQKPHFVRLPINQKCDLIQRWINNQRFYSNVHFIICQVKLLTSIKLAIFKKSNDLLSDCP